MRLLSENPLSGVKTYHDWDEEGQQHVITTHIDRRLTNAVIERNKAIEGQNMGSDMRLAASIPPEVQFEWLDKFGIEFWNPDHSEGVRRLLNSSEYRYLRVNNFVM